MTDPIMVPDCTRRPPRITWTTDMMLRLSELWQAEPPLSVSHIAAVLSDEFGLPVSKNAAIGKAHRLGFQSRTMPLNITEAREKKAQSVKRDRILQGGPRRQYTRAADTPLPPHMPIPPGAGTYPEHWLCQWPQVAPDDPIRCTEPRVEGRPYCRSHSRRAYTSFGVEYPKSTTVWLSSAGAIRRGQ